MPEDGSSNLPFSFAGPTGTRYRLEDRTSGLFMGDAVGSGLSLQESCHRVRFPDSPPSFKFGGRTRRGFVRTSIRSVG